MCFLLVVGLTWFCNAGEQVHDLHFSSERASFITTPWCSEIDILARIFSRVSYGARKLCYILWLIAKRHVIIYISTNSIIKSGRVARAFNPSNQEA